MRSLIPGQAKNVARLGLPGSPGLPETAPDLVLLVVRDPRLASRVVATLARQGLLATWTPDVKVAFEILRSMRISLVIVDVDDCAVERGRFLRYVEQASDVPRLLLSKRRQNAERNGCLAKPPVPSELLFQIRRLLATRADPAWRLVHGSLVLDARRCEVIVESRAVALTRSEFLILRALMRFPGRVFRRDELLDELYPNGDAVVDRVIDVHVGKLRQKLEADRAKPRIIGTIRGFGYKLLGAGR